MLALIYVALVLLLPPNAATSETYHLTPLAYHILMLFVALPLITVWFAAFYGYVKLTQYSRTVVSTADGKAFAQIALGLKWLAWGLPISSIVSTLFGGFVHGHPGFGPAAIIINHYLTLILSIVAFTIISNGTRALTNITGRAPSLAATRWLTIGFIFLAMSYCFTTIRIVQTVDINPYQLPLWLILFTIIMPYLYAWVMGLLAAFEISMYRRHVSGLLYKRGLNMLSSGIGLVIFTSIMLQYLTSSSPYLRKITFNWVLLLVYVILILYAAGFILIAIGAEKLRKIEEV